MIELYADLCLAIVVLVRVGVAAVLEEVEHVGVSSFGVE